jgi:hypothetical protein
VEIVLLILALGALMLGYKLGIDNGRRQTLENLNQRIVVGLEPMTDFARKYGVRGTHLVLDYLGHDAIVGTGFNPSPHMNFVVIHGDDFDNRFAKS